MIALPYIALIFFLALCVFVAEREAQEDARLIAANKPVAHTFMEWCERAAPIAVGFLIINAVWLAIEGDLDPLHWRIILWIPMAWGAFTVSFRLFLNGKRGFTWWYMDDLDTGGNLYDEMWWRIRLLFAGHGWRQLTTSEWEIMLSSGYAQKYERQVARIAYGTESLVLAVAGALFIINTN